MIATILYAAVHCKMSARKDLGIAEKVAILDWIHSQPNSSLVREELVAGRGQNDS